MAYWARTHHSRQRCVTNVVKLEHFETPFPCLCYKRRQSEPNNQYSQRKQHRIDDVCNKTQAGSPDRRPREAHEARPRYPWAAEGPGQASRQRTSTRQHTGPHWCGGCRRVRRARAGGPGCGAGGRRQGQGGPRDRPLRAAGSRVAISRAGRRPPAHKAARPHMPTVGQAGTDNNGWGAFRHPTRHQHPSTPVDQQGITPSPAPPRG